MLHHTTASRLEGPLSATYARILVLAAIIAFLPAIGIMNNDVLADETKDEYDAHASNKYYFDCSDMDFNFGNLVLGSAGNNGAEIGEAFYAASRIECGNALDWQTEWFHLAERVEARGRKSLASGHKVSARNQLQRAANYYRISLLSIVPGDPRFEKRGRKARSLMQIPKKSRPMAGASTV